MTPDIARLAGRRSVLEARARIKAAVRAYFDAQGFLEVDTPTRVRSPGQEVHLDAIPAGDDRFLITSPEYHMKRLVAAGYHRIYQLARSFRADERGPNHQPEFTMVEWYRAGEPLARIAADCEELLRAAAHAARTYPAVTVPPGRAAGAGETGVLRLDVDFERTTVAALMSAHAGLDVNGDESPDELRRRIQAAGHDPGSATAWDDLSFQLFLDAVEPHLGVHRPTFVFDWPMPLAALARRKPGAASVAERFELYAGGLELANAFGELTDPVEQRRRFGEESRARALRRKDVYPVDEQLLTALGHMPETAGVALGFDRLVMLVVGAADIRDVLPFADDEI